MRGGKQAPSVPGQLCILDQTSQTDLPVKILAVKLLPQQKWQSQPGRGKKAVFISTRFAPVSVIIPAGPHQCDPSQILHSWAT